MSFHFSARNLTRVGAKNVCDFSNRKRKAWETIEEQPRSNFSCELDSRQCEYRLSSGRRCRNRTKKTLPYCWQHNQLVLHVNVQKSRIKGAGAGLFACDRDKAKGQIVFKRGDKIAIYARKATKGKPAIGEFMPNEKLADRYGECITGPYAIDTPEEKCGVDTACERSIGSYANTTGNKRKINALVKWMKNNTELWLIATRGIANGSEIYLSYGENYRYGYPEFFEYKSGTKRRRNSHAKCRKRKR